MISFRFKTFNQPVGKSTKWLQNGIQTHAHKLHLPEKYIGIEIVKILKCKTA